MRSRDTLLRLKRFQLDEKRRQVAQIEMMIADFNRMASELDQQIISEQSRAGIDDPTHFAYPMFAKAAMQRRDNLKASVENLQNQLADAQNQLQEAFEELKKFELLEERDQGREKVAEGRRDRTLMDDLATRGVVRLQG